MITRSRSRLIKVVGALVLAELAYLLLLNAALRLPLTQTLVNMIRPEKFHVSWDSAWTWYPFRAHAVGVHANGQSRTQQWELSAARASGSIAILPLLLKRVWLSDVDATDVTYRQRPRLKPGQDYSARIPFFPEISGRQIQPVETRPRKKRRPWHVRLENARARGSHDVWIYEWRAGLEGHARGGFSYRTRGGPMSMDVMDVQLHVGQLFLNGDREVFRQGDFSGDFRFAPFVPRENKGLAMLPFLSLDTVVDVDVDSLAFINIFTQSFEDLTVGGRGEVDGRLRLDRGTLLAGTGLEIEAHALVLDWLRHRIDGEGTVDLEVLEDESDALRLLFTFREFEVHQPGASAAMLVGDKLELLASSDTDILSRQPTGNRGREVQTTIGTLSVPDLALLDRYLPGHLPVRLLGGEGQLQGTSSIGEDALSVSLRVDSRAANLAIEDYSFVSDLETAIELSNPDYRTSGTSVAGSYLKLQGASLLRGGAIDQRPWNASLQINDGSFHLLNALREDDSDLLGVLRAIDMGELLPQSRGSLQFEGEMSRLDWLGQLIAGDLIGRVRGSGVAGGVLELEAGLPVAGTDIEVRSADLAIDILDYTAKGDGTVGLRVAEGGQNTDWTFDAMLSDASLRRSADSAGVVDGAEARLSARVDDVRLGERAQFDALRFSIDSATLRNMGVLNDFLPAEAPLQFLAGEAALTADLALLTDDARGWLRLESDGVTARVDRQTVTGDIDAEVLVQGGRPQEMIFDIAGSSVRLDRVRVDGGRKQVELDDWSTRLDLTTARVQWRKPLDMVAGISLTMSDTRPFVAMFDNSKWRPPFVSRLLRVDNIAGYADVEAAGGVFTFPDVSVTSDHIEIGARGSIAADRRDGMLYLRYRKADALIQIHDGQREVDVVRARSKYDRYSVTPLVHSELLGLDATAF